MGSPSSLSSLTIDLDRLPSDSSVKASRKAAYLILSLGLVASLVAVLAPGTPRKPVRSDAEHVVRRPVLRPVVDDLPPEVREFLDRVRERIPSDGTEVSGYRFDHWPWPGKPTHEALGLKAIAGVDSEALIARVMDVDGYVDHIPHVTQCRSVQSDAFTRPEKVRFFQVIRVPRVAKVQHELVLVDLGTVKGYRLACWYLLKDDTEALDPEAGARSEFNIGAWLAAPGVVGYALSSWPRRADVNALQWLSLTTGANALSRSVVEGNIDAMAAWSKA